MTLHIQDPTDPESSYLIDTLREACEGAVRGAGAFAFVSAGGVKLFFRDPVFKAFAEQGGEFSLVAGVNAITDTKAVAALDEVRAETAGALEAKIHIPRNAIFHPKVAWFERPKGSGVLIAGSGNLTGGGLRWNVEAFNVSELSKSELKDVVARWDAFVARSGSSLLETSDPDVVARLEANAKLRATVKKLEAKAGLEPTAEAAAEIADETGLIDAVPAVTAQVQVLGKV